MSGQSSFAVRAGMAEQTVYQRLKSHASNLTPLERRLADLISSNYPVSGLGSITALADKAAVSSPTVARLVQKLGFSGFPEFQQTLREEVDRKLSGASGSVNPWNPNVPEAHILNKVAEAVVGNVGQSLEAIDVDDFEAMCNLLCDESRTLFLAGGRVTRALADHLHVFMQVIRPNLRFMNGPQAYWMYNAMDIKKDDILLVYDIRRYENTLLLMAQKAHEKGALIVLITDQWQSPIAEFAQHVLNARIVMPTGRDSLVTLMLLNEVIISQVHLGLGETATSRTQELEGIFAGEKFFKRS